MKILTRVLFTVILVFSLSAVIAPDDVSAKEVTVNVLNQKGKKAFRAYVNTADASKGLNYIFSKIRYEYKGKPMIVKLPKETFKANSVIYMYSDTTLDMSSGARLTRGADKTLLVMGMYEKAKGYSGIKNVKVIGKKGSYGTIDGGKHEKSMVRFAHASNISFKYIRFTNVCDSHHLEFAASKNVVFYKCIFDKFIRKKTRPRDNVDALSLDILHSRHFPAFPKYDGTVTKNVYINKCKFYGVQRGTGTHSGITGQYMKNINVVGNKFTNVEGYAVMGLMWQKSTISNNTIKNCGAGIAFRHINDSHKNIYKGSRAINKKSDSVISRNTISVKKTTFRNVPYGISLYGEKLKSKDGQIPKGDYRLSKVKVCDNKVSVKVKKASFGIWARGVTSSTIDENRISVKSAEKTGSKDIELSDCKNVKVN